MDDLKRFYLKRQNAPDEQYRIIPFKRDEVSIGRSQDVTFVITNNLISRKHAIFTRVVSGSTWIVKNLSLNGVFVNGDLVPKEEQREVEVGDIIQFGMPDLFVYRLGMKQICLSRQGTSSHAAKRIKPSSPTGDLQLNLTQEHASLEKKLRESDALQARLQEERDSVQVNVRKQRDFLEQQYQTEREMLEQKYAAGSVAQQSMLEEKEALAERLEQQVMELQNRLDQQHKTLEEKLKNEEDQRHKISREKEDVLQKLEEEKRNLEQKMQEERRHLQDQLQTTESHREELQKQVEAKESMIRAKEEEQQRANEERQQLKDQLAQEKQALQEELDKVRSDLEKKNKNFLDLDSELKSKEEELQDRMMSLESGVQERVIAEVEKNSALARQQLDELKKDKTDLEEKLKRTQEHDQEERRNLEDALSTVEAQKLSLEQELACNALSSDIARKEVVDSVSDVLENELQCPICNELFITAMMLGCSHTFCKYCIEQWKKNKRECPNCRAHIVSETRSLVVDNFIDKIVPTLSEEMQQRRSEIVAERTREIAAMAAAAALAAATAHAAASTSRAGRRGGRGRGRGASRQRQANRPPPPPPPVHRAPPPPVNRPPPPNNIPLNIVRPMGSVILLGMQGLNTAGRNTVIRIPHATSGFQSTAVTSVTQVRPITVIVPRPQAGASAAQAPQPQVAVVSQSGQSASIGAGPTGSTSNNPIVLGAIPSARPPIRAERGRRGHWASGCPERW